MNPYMGQQPYVDMFDPLVYPPDHPGFTTQDQWQMFPPQQGAGGASASWGQPVPGTQASPSGITPVPGSGYQDPASAGLLGGVGVDPAASAMAQSG